MLENGTREESLSVRAVARAVGVSAMTPYLHFADRGALLAAVYDERLRDLTVELAAAVGGGRPAPAARLRALADAYVTYGRLHPGPYRLLFGAFDPESDGGASGRDGRPAAATSFFAGLLGLVVDCLTEALGSTADADPAGLPGGPVESPVGPERVGGAARRPAAPAIPAAPAQPADAATRIAAAIWLGLHGLVTLPADKPSLAWPVTATVVDDLLAAHLGIAARA
jgi:AcrR family transcriptional regulator